jgi:hypothetical protein
MNCELRVANFARRFDRFCPLPFAFAFCPNCYQETAAFVTCFFPLEGRIAPWRDC